MHFKISVFVLLCSIAKLLDSFAMPNDVTLPLQQLIDEGTRYYYSSDWSASVDMFEKSLINYKMRTNVDSTCMAKCGDASITSQIHMDFAGFDDLYHLGNVLAQADCLKLCKEEHPYGDVTTDLPEKEILDDFERRKPYNFLQYAYYQLGKVKKAARAAQTYYNVNFEDEQASDNLQFYKSMEITDETFFEDLEAPKFHKLFEEAVRSYEEKNYKQAASQFERVLLEFFTAVQECLSLCHKPLEHSHFHRLYKSFANHFLDMLHCSLECENKLSPVVSNVKISNFLSTVYSYLQFSYFSIGKVNLAVPAAASAFLLNPDDENARYNLDYYESAKEEHQLAPSHFQPRDDASDFHRQKEAIMKILQTRNTVLNENDEGEVQDDNEEESWIPDLTNEVRVAVNEALDEIVRAQ